MFDIGASELLLTAIVAIIVIGPKDLPRALRLAGGWIAKVRRVSGHFKSGIEEMIRQAELDEMEKKWREQNEAIIKNTAAASPASAEAALPPPAAEATYDYPYPDHAAPDYPTAPVESGPAEGGAAETGTPQGADSASPELPLASPKP